MAAFATPARARRHWANIFNTSIFDNTRPTPYNLVSYSDAKNLNACVAPSSGTEIWRVDRPSTTLAMANYYAVSYVDPTTELHQIMLSPELENTLQMLGPRLVRVRLLHLMYREYAHRCRFVSRCVPR
jgi:hypothetical protein